MKTFFGHKAQAFEKISLRLQKDEKCCQARFFVTELDVPVTLSGGTAERLGLIIRVAAVENTDQLYEPARPYEDVFHGLGQPKGVLYHTKLKPESLEVIKLARRVTVTLQDQVKVKLPQRMEADGVIVKVTGAT